MSHVDDGMLHAYLDGALSALDAVRVERHVAECGSCQQRLDAARGLIQRAARLLEWASPPADRAAPPLAALRPVAVPRWRVPVAWAATIVLALGAGIYGGGILLRPSGAKEEVFEADRRAPPITVLADSPTAREANATAGAPAPVPEPPAPVAVTGAGVVQLRESTVNENKMADAAAKARADTAAALAFARRQEVAPPASAQAAAAPLARDTTSVSANQAAGERRVSGYSSTSVARAPAAADAGAVLPIITADSARALLGTAPVALPDYPVNSIRASAQGVVTVEQIVPPGRVIRLVQRRAVADEEGRAAGEALARYVDGLRVEITGPMAADSLSMLLGRARAVP